MTSILAYSKPHDKVFQELINETNERVLMIFFTARSIKYPETLVLAKKEASELFNELGKNGSQNPGPAKTKQNKGPCMG